MAHNHIKHLQWLVKAIHDFRNSIEFEFNKELQIYCCQEKIILDEDVIQQLQNQTKTHFKTNIVFREVDGKLDTDIVLTFE